MSILSLNYEKDNTALQPTRRKLLFVTLEPIAGQMAGPAIRAFELGRQLSDEFDVSVFSPRCSNQVETESFRLFAVPSKQKLYESAGNCQIIYVQANVLKAYPQLSKLGKYLVVDLYDPYLLSVLAQYADDPGSSSTSYSLMHKVLEKHMASADFSICASERQRDYWIGRYCALGRLTPQMYKFDPSFRKLIDVVPFGLPERLPEKNGPGMKEQVAGINAGDRVLLWGGGIWEWFDPLTVIEAVSKLSSKYPNLKLFFMGWKSPNPQVPLMDMALKARRRAEELGVLDRQVIFHQSWVPYDKRMNYLLEADIAVSAHFDLPETRFAFRTRILDYLWAGLPILTTKGDQLADTIESGGAGYALPYGDVDAWVRAISRLLDNQSINQEMRDSARRLSRQFTWHKASEPLREFCRNPHHLPPFTRIKMPSLLERAKSVYSRGGSDMVLKRCRDIIQDVLRN